MTPCSPSFHKRSNLNWIFAALVLGGILGPKPSAAEFSNGEQTPSLKIPEPSRRLAIGFQDVRAYVVPYGNPSVRWWWNKKNALEAGILIGRYSRIVGESLGLMQTLREGTTMRLYMKESFEWIHDTSGRFATIGIGPEVEVFLPSIPRMSFSLNTLVAGTYAYNDIYFGDGFIQDRPELRSGLAVHYYVF